MIKRILTIVGIVATVAISSSCSKDKKYADYVKEENELVDKYVKANDIVIVTSKPEQQEGEWLDDSGRPIYYETMSGLMYHQISLGDTTATKPKVSATAYIRYSGEDLYGKLIYSCMEQYSASPQSFTLLDKSSSSNTFGVGFQEAVGYMYKGGRCKAIISFKIGNGDNTTINKRTVNDAKSYIPMVYDIRLVNVQ